MPKLTEKLTDTVMKRLSVPTKGNVLYYDPTLKGFAGRVTHRGARAFLLVYRFRGEERRDTIGDSPAWSAKAARTVAENWRRDVRLGIDPRPEQPEQPAEDGMFEARAEAFLEHGRTKRGRPLRPATVREYKRALKIYAQPLHGRPVREIGRADVAEVIDATARGRGAVTGMRCRAALSRFWSWLVARGHADFNIVVGTEGYDAPKRSRVLSDGEIAAIWAATEEPGAFNLIVRIMVWTGCRRQEAGSMADSELSDGLWTVSRSRTKNHRPLVLPLPRQALAALAAWPRRFGRDLLFGHGPNGFQAWSQSKARLDARLGFNRDWDLHDARRTVETRMAGLRIPKDHVNRVLNHAAGPITETYDLHAYLDEKAHALQTWADALERIVGEAPPNVLPLPRRAS